MFQDLQFKDNDAAMHFSSKIQLIVNGEQVPYVAMMNRIVREPSLLAKLLTGNVDIIAPLGFLKLDTENNKVEYWSIVPWPDAGVEYALVQTIATKRRMDIGKDELKAMEDLFVVPDLYPIYEVKEHEDCIKQFLPKEVTQEELWKEVLAIVKENVINGSEIDCIDELKKQNFKLLKS